MTLLIEYAVKPRLEARKDRVIDEHRRFREVVSRLNFLHGQVLEVGYMQFYSSEVHRLQKLSAEFGEEFRQLEANVHEVANVLSRRQLKAYRYCLGHITSELRMMELETRSGGFMEVMERAQELGVLDASGAPSIDVPSRIRSFLDKVEIVCELVEPEAWWRRRYHRHVKRIVQERDDRIRQILLSDDEPDWRMFLSDDKPT